MSTISFQQGTILPSPAYRSPGRKAQSTTRSRPDRKANKKSLPIAVPGLAFLNAIFSPKLRGSNELLSNQGLIEHGFFKSLTHLCEHYKLAPPAYQYIPYPLNMSLSFRWVSEQLSAHYPDLTMKLLQEGGEAPVIRTVRTFDTGRALFYIALEPLYYLMQEPERKQTTDLMRSVFAYLFQVVEIDHYSDNDCYLNYAYYVMADWAKQDHIDYEENWELLARFKLIKAGGKKTLRAIKSKKDLKWFQKRVQDFVPLTPAEVALQKTAKLALGIYLDFPTRSVYQMIHEQHPDDEYYEGVVRMDAYLSFYWSDGGMEYQALIDFVNTELQEYCLFDEPTIIHYFNELPAEPEPSFEFEDRLFDMLHELCDTLLDFKKERDERLNRNH